MSKIDCKLFPTEEVFRITGVKPSPECPRFKGLSRDSLGELIDIGVVSLDDEFNNCPSVGKMLRHANNADITFEGYIVGPPREDCRVTVDGYTMTIAGRDDARLSRDYWDFTDYEPDERDIIELPDNRFSVRLWWD